MKPEKSKIVAIIPARGGSKSVPKKNIQPLAGKPLIYYTINAALKSRYLDRVIVSTDDEEIARVSRSFGAEIPFMRPKELAGDKVPDIPVIKQAVDYLEKNEDYFPEVIVFLRPTSPLRTTKDIDDAIKKFLSIRCDSVRTICQVDYPPFWMKKLVGDRLLPFIKSEYEYVRRQDVPKVYKGNGEVEVIRADVIRKARNNNQMYGEDIRAIIMDQKRSIDIDTGFDFIIAERFMKERKQGK